MAEFTKMSADERDTALRMAAAFLPAEVISGAEVALAQARQLVRSIGESVCVLGRWMDQFEAGMKPCPDGAYDVIHDALGYSQIDELLDLAVFAISHLQDHAWGAPPPGPKGRQLVEQYGHLMAPEAARSLAGSTTPEERRANRDEPYERRGFLPSAPAAGDAAELADGGQAAT